MFPPHVKLVSPPCLGGENVLVICARNCKMGLPDSTHRLIAHELIPSNAGGRMTCRTLDAASRRDAIIVSDDVILEQVEFTYDPAGNLIQAHPTNACLASCSA